jgi:hypothetical protein
LLPTVYWHQQLHKTQNPRQREKYLQAWQRAAQHLQTDPFTATLPENELQRWLEWAEWIKITHFTPPHNLSPTTAFKLRHAWIPAPGFLAEA